MAGGIVLFISILLQFAAAFFALSLISLTRHRLAWSLIAGAVLLMAVRRSVTFGRYALAEVSKQPDLAAESIALVISILMLAGIFFVRRVFVALKEAEEANRFAQLSVDSSSEAVFWIRPDATFSYVNDAAVKRLGFTREELLSKGVGDIDPCFPMDGWQEHWRELKKKGSLTFETSHKSKDGQLIPVEITANFMEFEGAEFNCAYTRDITERKEAEQQLGEAHELLERAFSTSHMMIAYLDTGLNFIRVNDTYAKANQHPPEYFPGKNHFQLYPNEENEKIFRTVARTGEPYTVIAKPFEHPDHPELGVTYWDWTLQPVKNAEGDIEGLFLFLLDVTRHKQAEKEISRLFRAIEHSAEMILITDVEGKIQYVNPAFEKQTGYSREETIGKSANIIQSGRHTTEFFDELWADLKAGNIWTGRFVNRRKDGTIFEADTTISPVPDSSGANSGYVSVMRNVTGEAMLQRAKDYFTSVTSHELRTPLTKIKLARLMISELDQSAGGGEERDRIISALDESSDEFERVISATEMFSMLTEKQDRSGFRPWNVELMLMHAIEVAKENAREAGRELKIKFESDPALSNLHVLIDEAAFRRALDETLSNAVKYTPDGRSIRILGEVKNGSVTVTVCDEGIGIAPERIERIFDPFFSLEDHMKHTTGQYRFKGGGIGIGMTLVKMIMEFHDGAVKIQSQGEDKGTTVTLTLPIRL